MANIPGGNLLNKALTVITRQSFQYVQFLGNVDNDIGQAVPTYATPIPLTGSAQPPARQLMEQYGLQFNQNNMVFFSSHHILDVTRESSGDHILFAGKRWQVLYIVPWYTIDGWNQIITVEVKGPATAC